MFAHFRLQGEASREDGIGIDIVANFACEVRFARRREGQRDEGRLEHAVIKGRAESVEQAAVPTYRLRSTQARDVVEEETCRQRLQCLPAIERVGHHARPGIATRRAERLAMSLIGAENPRLSEGNRRLADVAEHERLRRLGQGEHAALDRAARR